MIRVLDTSTIIHDPELFENEYLGDTLVVPFETFRELNTLKKGGQHPGSEARRALSFLEDSILEASEDGMLESTVEDFTITVSEKKQARFATKFTQWERDNGGYICAIVTESTNLHDGPTPEFDINDVDYGLETGDKGILNIARALTEKEGDVTLVTRDRALIITATALGVKAEINIIPESRRFNIRGTVEVEVEDSVIDDFYSSPYELIDAPEEAHENNGVILKSKYSPSKSAIGLVNSFGKIQPLYDKDLHAMNVTPHGIQQKFAMAQLLGVGSAEPVEFLGSLSGRAGSGKTLVALAAGLERTLKQGEYERIIIFRPTESVGPDLGFLPGNLEEKMAPWKEAINDVLRNMNFHLEKTDAEKEEEKNNGSTSIYSTETIPEGLVEVLSVTHIRGRTFENAFIIVEEAQNYEPTVLKTIITRAGHGSCVVMTWDPSQVDNIYNRNNHTDGPGKLVGEISPNAALWHYEFDRPERGGVSALVE